MGKRLIEQLRVVPVAVPIDTTGAAVASDWINLKNFKRVLFIVSQGAWAGGTPALTFLQAKTNAGGSSKALSYTEKWTGTALTTDVPTKATVSSDTSNLSATANSFTLVEFSSDDLDLANDFTHIQLAIASPGANADLISVIAILGDGAYSGLPSTLPTVID